MIFYRIVGSCSEELADRIHMKGKGRQSHYEYDSEASKLNAEFNSMFKVDRKYMIAICDLFEDRMTVSVAFDASATNIDECIACIEKTIPSFKTLEEEELTLDDYKRELCRANEWSWLSRSDDYIIRELNLRINSESFNFFEGAAYKISEKVYSDRTMTKKKCTERLSEIMASDSFCEEIERIYSKSNEKLFKGHPVHYLITAGDKSAAEDMISILIPALLKNKRLRGGRVCDVDKLSARAYREENFHNIFDAAQGGTVIINLSVENSGQYANGYHELTEYIGKKLKEFGNETLFIFVDVSGKRNIADEAMSAILSNADMIHIDEGYGDATKAGEYLNRLAAKTGYSDYKISDLTRFLPVDKTEYSVSDIYGAYNRWYGSGLKTHVYRAYKEQDIVKLAVKKKECKPYEELQKMIGLEDVKRVTDEIIANARMMKARKAMGLDTTGASMHMLFAGNPGSAKTTVARLLAQILKDEEVLKNGHLVECGRQDLVAKYVGWTAKTVEEKFRAARGGILFIDEAYSLVEDHNSFGTEAINAIVQLMENYRDEVIVIFAGYPEKMSCFLDQNEGLKSRIAFHLNFPDYDAEELTGIMKLMLDKQGYSLLDDRAAEKVYTICELASREKDYGNGRFVRNLVEHATMRQANRLFKENSGGSVTKEQVTVLTAEDFELVGNNKKNRKALGFVG